MTADAINCVGFVEEDAVGHGNDTLWRARPRLRGRDRLQDAAMAAIPIITADSFKLSRVTLIR
ncbi:MAG: hypothetical protein AB7N65_10350 [Vicinamibacterales bacterium]